MAKNKLGLGTKLSLGVVMTALIATIVYAGWAENGNNLVTTQSATITSTVNGTPLANTLYSESLPKAWVRFDGDSCTLNSGGSCGSSGGCPINAAFNVECVDRNAAGDYTIYWDRDFTSGDDYTAVAMAGRSSTNGLIQATNYPDADHDIAAGSFRLYTVASNGFNSGVGIGGNNIDAATVQVIAFGLQ